MKLSLLVLTAIFSVSTLSMAADTTDQKEISSYVSREGELLRKIARSEKDLEIAIKLDKGVDAKLIREDLFLLKRDLRDHRASLTQKSPIYVDSSATTPKEIMKVVKNEVRIYKETKQMYETDLGVGGLQRMQDAAKSLDAWLAKTEFPEKTAESFGLSLNEVKGRAMTGDFAAVAKLSAAARNYKDAKQALKEGGGHWDRAKLNTAIADIKYNAGKVSPLMLKKAGVTVAILTAAGIATASTLPSDESDASTKPQTSSFTSKAWSRGASDNSGMK